jgi:integrase
MAIHRLGPTALNRKTPGLYADGGGLYLQVTVAKDGKGRNRSWIFRFAIPDAARTSGYRDRQMGLGSCDTVSLAEARDKALRYRKLRLDGIDPIEARDEKRAVEAAAAAKVMTFDQCMHAYLAAHRAKWRNQKHAQEWVATLAKNASPVFGRLPVQTIDLALVMKALEPIWHAKPETASRLRGRIESILDWATVRGFRHGDNPARWSNYLEKLLPSRRDLAPVVHHAAMPYVELPGFMARLRERQGTAERALEWTILCCARTGETLGAEWEREINFTDKTWTIPGSRMKAGKEHRVPLGGRCLEILAGMEEVRRNVFVFPGARSATMAPASLALVLKRMGATAVTVHGFRSSFRDWCREQTNFAREIAEQALAHHVGNAVERAYARGDLLEKRRLLMDAWAAFCARPLPAGVTSATPMQRKVAADA